MSHELHHFALGKWVLGLAYLTSITGSYVGLLCARQATRSRGSIGRAWMVMAAAALGGVGVWLTHFIAMMGFAVPGTLIRYNPPLTVFSAVAAMAATGLGLWLMNSPVVPKRHLRVFRSMIGGMVIGAAVSVMHYSGMAAIRIQGKVDHASSFVAVSIIIGIVAATIALWLTSHPTSGFARASAAVVMGGAVAAVHYIGMAGTAATISTHAPAPQGWTVMSLLLPTFVLGTLVLAVPLVALIVGTQPTHADPDADTGHHLQAATPRAPLERSAAAAPDSGRLAASPTRRPGRYLDATTYVPRTRPTRTPPQS
ncbi:signal protein (plasmid) [Rhodococcus pyridinivorans]|uniref:MHYT domain-containing protein n=1 Tax=Rhodococcus pyridinivorans TaxID=103816 RepID=UPI0020C717E7|nr:MHYT domain-containing protein [Rhodococcus pyridinivorans]UTM40147.1 signal protein [Rhodococcus pyridinivorans]